MNRKPTTRPPAPRVQASTSIANDPTSSDSANFTFHSNDGDATFECRLDSDLEGDFTSCTSPQNYTGLDEGEHTFEVRATDEFDRTDPIPASYTWDVDLTAPTVTIDSAPDDPTNETTGVFEFSSADNTATFQCKLDGRKFKKCKSPLVLRDLDPGKHKLRIRATDAVGNVSPTVVYGWKVLA